MSSCGFLVKVMDYHLCDFGLSLIWAPVLPWGYLVEWSTVPQKV